MTLQFKSRLTALGIASLMVCGAAQAETVLKLSHQFPGGKGDVRDEMVQMIARDVAAANVDMSIKIFPGSSLVKPQEQWKADRPDRHGFVPA